MSPQPRGLVPAEHVAALLTARAESAEADERYRTAVADALKAGGSIREVAAVTGLSTRTVQAWGRARGWPTEAQAGARADERARNRDWDERMGRGRS